jgi:hypothetical protein
MDDKRAPMLFYLRKSQRLQIAQLAAEADMPMRSFILTALRSKGLAVLDEDLVDRRGAPKRREPVSAE